MPYQSPQAAIDPADELPQHLAHRPFYAFPYQAFDVLFDPTTTDMRFLSVGIAQYDEEEVSLKVFRHSGNRWTRQSEELPLHRVIDAANFLARVLYDADHGSLELPAGTFARQEDAIQITPESRTFGERATFKRFLEEHEGMLAERFNALYATLKEMKERGEF